jgi:hypothetical protein
MPPFSESRRSSSQESGAEVEYEGGEACSDRESMIEVRDHTFDEEDDDINDDQGHLMTNEGALKDFVRKQLVLMASSGDHFLAKVIKISSR